MKELPHCLRLLLKKKKMNDEQKDALLSELMIAYATKMRCPLMDFLINDDFAGFEKFANDMIQVGIAIKKVIKSDLDSP